MGFRMSFKKGERGDFSDVEGKLVPQIRKMDPEVPASGGRLVTPVAYFLQSDLDVEVIHY